MRINTKKNHSKYRWILASVLIFLLLAGCTWGYFTFIDASDTQDSTGSTDTTQLNETDPTYSSDKNPNSNTETSTDSTSDESTSSNKTTVPVGITSARINGENVEVRAFITEVIEAGTCTAVFTREGLLSITASSNAFIDATTTQCDVMSAPVNSFASGTWSVTVEYLSSSATGVSSSFEVTIP